MASKHQEESYHLKAARELIAQAMQAPLTLEEREKKAIELASHILSESNRSMTKTEAKKQGELSRMMRDPVGKAFTTAMSDQCFRSHDHKRIADQLIYLLSLFGIPRFLAPFKRLQLFLFKMFGIKFSGILVPIATYFLRKNTSTVIIPGEKGPLIKHIKRTSGTVCTIFKFK